MCFCAWLHTILAIVLVSLWCNCVGVANAVEVSSAYPKKNVMIGVTGNYVPSFGVSDRPSAMLGISHETLKYQIDLFGRVIRYRESTRQDLSLGALYFFINKQQSRSSKRSGYLGGGLGVVNVSEDNANIPNVYACSGIVEPLGESTDMRFELRFDRSFGESAISLVTFNIILKLDVSN